MKKRWVIWLIVTVTAGMAGWAIWYGATDQPPVLAFKSYEKAEARAQSYDLGPRPEPVYQYAVFELKNVSQRAVWIELLGSSTSAITNVNYLQRYNYDNGSGLIRVNSRVSVTAGILFLDGRKLQPGESVAFRVPMSERKHDHMLGIAYYSGDFKDADEFLRFTSTLTGIHIPSAKDGLKAKLAYWWARIVARKNIRSRHEVWYPEALEHARMKGIKTGR